jgi:hypothetical protein
MVEMLLVGLGFQLFGRLSSRGVAPFGGFFSKIIGQDCEKKFKNLKI